MINYSPSTRVFKFDTIQVSSQEFATRVGKKRGSGGRKSSAGSRGRAPVGVWGEAPRSRRQMLISSYDGGHAPMSPLGYATDTIGTVSWLKR